MAVCEASKPDLGGTAIAAALGVSYLALIVVPIVLARGER
jgi:hypothetical protein